MKKMIALLAAVAVFGMGKIASAQDVLPGPQSFMDITINAYTETQDWYGGEDLNVQGGIHGEFGMQAFSGAENVPNTELQYVGTGVEVFGGADLDLYDDDIVFGNDQEPCALCPDDVGPGDVIGQTGGWLGIDLTAGGAAGFDSEVAWAESGSMSIVGSGGDAEGSAGIASGAISSNGDVGAWSGSGSEYGWLLDD